MKGFSLAALGVALVMAAGFVPAGAVRAQDRDTLVRAFDVVRGSRIGASVHDIEDGDAKDAKGKAGVVVDSVEASGPADKAGVKTGDTITEFDGERVRSVRQFSRLVQETPSGRSVAVALSRGSQHLTVNLTAERGSSNDGFAMRLLADGMPRPAMPPEPPEPPRAPRAPMVTPALPFDTLRLVGGRRLGISVETLDDQLAQYFGVKEGVLVRSVTDESSAQKAGLKAGDVITALNGRKIYEASDVNRALDRMDNTDEFTLEIVRDRKAQTLKGKLDTPVRSRGVV